MRTCVYIPLILYVLKQMRQVCKNIYIQNFGSSIAESKLGAAAGNTCFFFLFKVPIIY